MTNARVNNQQRFLTSSSACPICGGYERTRRGNGERCAGYMSSDGEYAHCTRDEYAGAIEPTDASPPTYPHKMHGPCTCGVNHRPARPSQNRKQDRRVEKEYPYYDEEGNLLFKVIRYDPKDFRPCHAQNGRWIFSMEGVRHVLYRLPDLLKADPAHTVYLSPSEKDVDNLRKLGLVSTCNCGGDQNWRDEYSASLKGRDVVLLPHNDLSGKKWAADVTRSLQGSAKSVRTVHLPGLGDHGDVSDWIATGGAREELEKLASPPKRRFTYASEVQEQEIEWLWKGRIARGCFALAVGDAGVGKGLSTIKMIGAITKGKGLPGEVDRPPAGVILMSPEESASRTLVPRLKAADADLEKVLLLTMVDELDPTTGETYQRPMSFPEDVHILREAMEDAGAVLVVIDPILSLLSGKVDAYKNHAVRQALMQLMSTAEQYNCAVLGIIHTIKTPHPNVLFRSSSSSAFIEMARTALFFVPDPDGEAGQSGVIVNYKNNLVKHAASERYAIHENEKHIGYITWKGESSRTRDELLNPHSPAPAESRTSEKEDGLMAVLKGSEQDMTVEEIHKLLDTKQSLDALTKMLQRKVEQGTLIRPERGKFTYSGNPSYADTPNPTEEPQSDIQNVQCPMSNSETPLAQLDMPLHDVQSTNGHKVTSEGALKQLDILDIGHSDMVKISPSTAYDGPYPPENRLTLCHQAGWHWNGERYVCNVCYPLEVAV